jgi:DNA repair protein RadC
MSSHDKPSVKQWSPDDQPREKLMLKGIAALSNAELVAIIIHSGSAEESSVELAQRILRSVDNSLARLGRMSVEQLTANFKGIGQAKAIGIVAALELGRRREAEEPATKDPVRSSSDLDRYFRPLLANLDHEEMWAAYFDSKQKIIARKKISQGGVAETPVDCKIILHGAIETLATQIAICHNHPSGDVEPSNADRALTHKIAEGAKILGFQFIDHLIIGTRGYYSFAENGIL